MVTMSSTRYGSRRISYRRQVGTARNVLASACLLLCDVACCCCSGVVVVLLRSLVCGDELFESQSRVCGVWVVGRTNVQQQHSNSKQHCT